MHADTLMLQFGFSAYVINKNTDGLSHEDSLIQPHLGGNCVNWVIGHIVHSRIDALAALGKEAPWSPRNTERYRRGSAPVTDGGDAVELQKLLDRFRGSQQLLLEGLKQITPARLVQPASVSPGGKPGETVGSLLAVLFFHEAYHAGQTGVLRRIAGKPGVLT